ncbi:MAG: hypothetical protein ABF679_10180 [Lentilactobacillus diolivorans]
MLQFNDLTIASHRKCRRKLKFLLGYYQSDRKKFSNLIVGKTTNTCSDIDQFECHQKEKGGDNSRFAQSLLVSTRLLPSENAGQKGPFHVEVIIQN